MHAGAARQDCKHERNKRKGRAIEERNWIELPRALLMHLSITVGFTAWSDFKDRNSILIYYLELVHSCATYELCVWIRWNFSSPIKKIKITLVRKVRGSQTTQQEKVWGYGRTETPAVICVQVVVTNIEHTDQWDGLRKRCQTQRLAKGQGEGRGGGTCHGIVKTG